MIGDIQGSILITPPAWLRLDALLRQGGDESLPDRYETTCGLAGPPCFHPIWEPFCRMEHLFFTFSHRAGPPAILG